MRSTPRVRALCAVGAAAALVAVPGCGGKSNTDKTKQYKTDAQKVANTFKTQAQSASQQIQTESSKSGKIKGLEALKASVNNAANGFAKLDPPDTAKAKNAELVTELRTLAGDVDSVESALKTNDATKARSALPRLQADQSKIQSTLQDLEQQIGK